MHRLMRYSALIGLILFVLVIFSIRFDELFRIMKEVNLWWVLAGSALIPLEAYLKSWKLKIMVNTHTRFSWKGAIKTYLVGLPYGAVTPGKVGDLAKIYVIKRMTSLRTVTGFAILVAERLIELITLLLLALAGLTFVLIESEQKVFFLGPIFLIAAIIVGSIAALNSNVSHMISRSVYKLIIPERYRSQLKDSFNVFYAGISQLMGNKGSIWTSFLLSFMAWMVISSRAFLYAHSMNIGVSFLYFLLLIPAVIAVELLPISIMGMGTREYALILLFATFGIGREYAVSLSLMTFLLGPIPPTILGYFIALRDHLSMGRIRELPLAEESS